MNNVDGFVCWYDLSESIRSSSLHHLHQNRCEKGVLTLLDWLLYVEGVEGKLRNEQLDEESEETTSQRRFWTPNVEVLEERPKWLENFEKLILIPGVCVHIINEVLQMPQPEHIAPYLEQKITTLEEDNIESLSSRIDINTLKIYLKRFNEKQSLKNKLNTELNDELNNNMIQSFYSMLPNFNNALDFSKNDHTSNVVLAGRMISSCIRNLLIIHFVNISSTRDTTNDTFFSIHASTEALIEERDIIIKQVLHTIALVDVCNREMHRLHVFSESAKKSILDYKNYDLAMLHSNAQNKKIKQLEDSVKHWQKVLHSHLSTDFLKSLRWFNSRVKRYMEVNGRSVELLTREILDYVMRSYGVISSAEKSEREFFKSQQRERLAFQTTFNQPLLNNLCEFEQLYFKCHTQQNKNVHLLILYFDDCYFERALSFYDSEHPSQAVKKPVVNKTKKKKQEESKHKEKVKMEYFDKFLSFQDMMRQRQ
ncbi:hypothetical protein AKO1_010961 [Acrasis kona]|uniref:Exocyst complex component Sec8 n=1 Tax=Acrasis kona TaxID=1008807 RepID=A0AAW2YQR4_9EUKA